jgi:hypothetical protein
MSTATRHDAACARAASGKKATDHTKSPRAFAMRMRGLLAACALLVPSCTTQDTAPFVAIDLEHAFRPFVFGGDGAMRATPNELVLEPGAPLTGGTFAVDLPRDAYEVAFRAARLSGIDFFCGLTFPTLRGELTLVLGGWGGTVCGLSSLDGEDASSNDTRTLRHFKNGVDAAVRVRVDGDDVRVFVDEQPFLAASLRDREVSVRAEVEPCRPFGFCCYLTTARIADLRWRPLRPTAR